MQILGILLPFVATLVAEDLLFSALGRWIWDEATTQLGFHMHEHWRTACKSMRLIHRHHPIQATRPPSTTSAAGSQTIHGESVPTEA